MDPGQSEYVCETLLNMTFMSQKLSLKWNDFHRNVINSLHDWRKDSDFCDVTLLCDGDQQIEAHRIIITACSPFFSSVLKKNMHSHPMKTDSRTRRLSLQTTTV